MATVINNPGDGSTGDGGMGVVMGTIIAIVLIIILFLWVIPAIRGNQPADNKGIDVNVDLPSGLGGSPSPSPSPSTPTPSPTPTTP